MSFENANLIFTLLLLIPFKGFLLKGDPVLSGQTGLAEPLPSPDRTQTSLPWLRGGQARPPFPLSPGRGGPSDWTTLAFSPPLPLVNSRSSFGPSVPKL